VELLFNELKSRFGLDEITTTDAYIIEALIIVAAISLLMSRVIVDELRTLEANRLEGDAADADSSELLLWVSQNPNPHRERLREQVESGEFAFDRH